MLYEYGGVFHQATYLSRPNRFLAEVNLNGDLVLAHVKNTGRMKELLKEGNTCYIREADNPGRKTKYDLITIEASGVLVNLDSQIPNQVISDGFKEGLIRGYPRAKSIKREFTLGDSRLDMKVDFDDKELFVEVKGVDLLRPDGVAMFPDAVSQRATKHLLSLESLVEEGKEAMVVFLIQRADAKAFTPHVERDPVFAETFRRVLDSGVDARAYLSHVGRDYIGLGQEVMIF